MDSEAASQPAPAAEPRPGRRWFLADAPEVDGVVAARCCLGNAFRENTNAYFCEFVCLSADLAHVLLEFCPIDRTNVAELEELSSLTARLSAVEIGEEEARKFVSVGWW
jgi:hypothetical protein